MTTPVPWEVILQVKDRPTLELIARVIEAQRVSVESQLSQLQDIQRALETRMREGEG